MPRNARRLATVSRSRVVIPYLTHSPPAIERERKKRSPKQDEKKMWQKRPLGDETSPVVQIALTDRRRVFSIVIRLESDFCSRHLETVRSSRTC